MTIRHSTGRQLMRCISHPACPKAQHGRADRWQHRLANARTRAVVGRDEAGEGDGVWLATAVLHLLKQLLCLLPLGACDGGKRRVGGEGEQQDGSGCKVEGTRTGVQELGTAEDMIAPSFTILPARVCHQEVPNAAACSPAPHPERRRR